MLLLSNDAAQQINHSDCKQTIELPYGTLELYLGPSADRLAALGLLNIIIRDQKSGLSACSIKELKDTNLIIDGQEGLTQPNTSRVMHIWRDGPEICAQHWDGFMSRFDDESMALLAQEFTK